MIDLLTSTGGNLGSIRRLLERTETPWREVSVSGELSGENPLLIPGVGSFGAVMTNLKKKGFVRPIRASAQKGIPVLGICSGMQILFESSEESPGVKGLGLIPGQVVRFTEGKVPNIGWSRLDISGDWVYFVNSFHARTEWVVDKAIHHGKPFTATAARGTVTGFQFHPEISHHHGEKLFRRWRNGL